MDSFVCHDLGLMRYGPCLELMEELHSQVSKGHREALWLAVEHEPVVTMGQRKLLGDLRFDPESHKKQAITFDYFEIDRGGSATAHEPGQLVIYPIVPLSLFNGSVKLYVEFLEEGVIQACRQFGIQATRDPVNPGVWCGGAKLAAVGVRVREHVTKHGLAFNINNDLSSFGAIVPCGLHNRGVTTLQREMAKVTQISGSLENEVVETTGFMVKVLEAMLALYGELSRSQLGKNWTFQRVTTPPR